MPPDSIDKRDPFIATTLVTTSFYIHFDPTPVHVLPCSMFTRHFHLAHFGILPFINIEWRNGGAGTYSKGITVMISCFCIFSNTISP